MRTAAGWAGVLLALAAAGWAAEKRDEPKAPAAPAREVRKDGKPDLPKPAASRKPARETKAARPASSPSSRKSSQQKLSPASRARASAGAAARPTTSTASAGARSSRPRAETASAAAADGPESRRAFPYDPYDLSLYFKRRWDALMMVISPEAELRYRADSARGRAQALTRMYGRFSAQVEDRQRGIRNATVALYLLGRARREPAYMGSPITAPHMLAIRSALKSEASGLEARLGALDGLREELNRAAARSDELAQLLRRGAPVSRAEIVPEKDGGTRRAPGVTRSVAEQVQEANRSVLDERRPGTAALLTALAMEQMAREARGRQTLQAFAPPPPQPAAMFTDYVPADTPLPRESGPGRSAPPDPKLERPETRGVEVVADAGAAIHAAAAGTVGFAGPFRGYGTLVIVEHEGGLFSVYGHLGGVDVEGGQRVSRGQRIGTAGSLDSAARPGAYFEVRKGEAVVAPSTLLGDSTAEKALLR